MVSYSTRYSGEPSKRALAVEAGAVSITWRETGVVSRHRRMVFLGKAAPMPILAILRSATE